MGLRRTLMNFCAYTHLWRVIKQAITERKLPDSAKPGLFIAALGFFCPLFWIALLTGASKAELIFHAVHSTIVFCIGIALLLRALYFAKDTTAAQQ